MATKGLLPVTIALSFFLLCMQGCGLLYTNVVRSDSRDFNNTPIGSKSFSLSAYRVQIPLFLPFSRFTRASAQWDNERINELARQTGMHKIYYSDFKTEEILMGTFRRQTIIVYGD